tara:strand:+ start:14484 stop:14738 length:255 start_codon:yes stop_codon:yes gene_type:complete
MARETNPCGKTRDIDEPYEIWKGSHPMFGEIEYRVLKKYQTPTKEKQNAYARWFVAAKSQATFGGWDYGDTYIADIKAICSKVA